MNWDGMSVCVCVCVCVKSHHTSGGVCSSENAAMYSAGNKGQTICGVFSKTASLWRLRAPSLGWPYIRESRVTRCSGEENVWSHSADYARMLGCPQIAHYFYAYKRCDCHVVAYSASKDSLWFSNACS